MGWDWANKNWNETWAFQEAYHWCCLKVEPPKSSAKARSKLVWARWKKIKSGEFGTCFVPPLTLCMLLLPKWLSRCFWWQKRTRKNERLVSVLNIRHRISTQELLSHGLKQCNYSSFFFSNFFFPWALTTELQSILFLCSIPRQWWKAQELQMLLVCKIIRNLGCMGIKCLPEEEVPSLFCPC